MPWWGEYRCDQGPRWRTYKNLQERFHDTWLTFHVAGWLSQHNVVTNPRRSGVTIEASALFSTQTQHGTGAARCRSRPRDLWFASLPWLPLLLLTHASPPNATARRPSCRTGTTPRSKRSRASPRRGAAVTRAHRARPTARSFRAGRRRSGRASNPTASTTPTTGRSLTPGPRRRIPSSPRPRTTGRERASSRRQGARHPRGWLPDQVSRQCAGTRASTA